MLRTGVNREKRDTARRSAGMITSGGSSVRTTACTSSHSTCVYGT